MIIESVTEVDFIMGGWSPKMVYIMGHRNPEKDFIMGDLKQGGRSATRPNCYQK
jgi:hypothetical protein